MSDTEYVWSDEEWEDGEDWYGADNGHGDENEAAAGTRWYPLTPTRGEADSRSSAGGSSAGRRRGRRGW